MELIIKNKKVLIDDDCFELFSKCNWTITEDGYVKSTNYYGLVYEYYKDKPGQRKQKNVLLHRYLLAVYDTRMMDHINGNRLDNRKSNLRFVDFFGNARNRRGVSTKLLPKGVFNSGYPNKKYRVRVQTKLGYRLEGGYFERVEDAVLKYNELSKQLFGEHHRDSII